MRIHAVLTDLDGTLLEHGGVLGEDARAAIIELKECGVPVVPLTSKTEEELRRLLADFDLGATGAFENGAGVLGPSLREVSEKAIPVAALAVRLDEMSHRSGLRLRPVTALPHAEIRRITGLSEARVSAMLARQFVLPFVAPDGPEGQLEAAVRFMPGLKLTRGGLFWHLSGEHGKEDALDVLIRKGLVYRPLAGFGDAPNDAAFLARCDVAVLVPRPNGSVNAALSAAVPMGRVAPLPAGRGWAAAALELAGRAS